MDYQDFCIVLIAICCFVIGWRMAKSHTIHFNGGREY